ncbi:zinc-dependent metalloprotease [Colwelliaceae bacterium 6471]
MNLLRNVILLLACCVLSVQANTDFTDFIKDKTYHQGYFSFYQDDNTGKIYLEISKFDQDFIFQSSLPQGIGSNDIGLDRGQLGDTRLVRFERVGEKVFLRQLNSYYRADSDNPLEKQAIDEAFASSIIWGFKVASISSDKQKVLIDYTPFLLSDIHNISDRLKTAKQGSFKVDESRSGIFAKRTKAFPANTELEATVTFKGSGAGDYLKSVTPEHSAITVNLHHSLIELPDDKYTPRQFHPNSGFWSVAYADYASAIDEPIVKRAIPRHRLAKKDKNASSSEAVEPIVYYLDAGVPEPVRSALIDGAKWWDQAFSAIGYKNAFQVKILPADADPMDVRYNVIQWVHRATRGWSYGSSVIDPRTGEIIKGHVTLGSLRVRQDYLIALGLTSPFTQPNTDTNSMKEMALARIRQLSAHEVGHTLGIAHNFAASVNDRASVMDYPHPFVQLGDGHIDLSQAYATDIGDWDKFVIAYGYSDLDANKETNVLAELIADSKAKGLAYISDPDARSKSSPHASAHLWDNGADPVAELTRVLEVRAHALANIGTNSIPAGTPLSEIEQVLVPIYNFHRYQVDAVAKLVAGLQYSYEVKSAEESVGVSNVSGKVQTQAISALISTLKPSVLTLPESLIKLIPPKAYGYSRDRESFKSNTGIAFDPISAADASINNTLNLLLTPERLARLEQHAALDDSAPDTGKLLSALLDNTLYQKSTDGMKLLIQQRANQQVVDHLLALWHQDKLVTEVRAQVYSALQTLAKWLDDNKDNRRKYKGLTAQFEMLAQQISFSFNHSKPSTPASKISLPPGSPIG